MKIFAKTTLTALGFVSAFTLASTVAEAAGPASRIALGDCSHPEPRKGSTFKHPSGGSVSVIGGNSDIVEFRFNGNCVRDYIRDGEGLGGNDIRLGTTRDGAQTILVRMGRNRDLIRVYAVLPNGTLVGAFDRIQDGKRLPTKAQKDGSFHVTYGRNKDLAGTYWYNSLKRVWQFGKASRGRNWAIKF
ncbi:MAG: hypothetical protein ABJM43_13025 [Paracoccaceae bacterium]